jgi:ribonuclease D
MSNGISFYAGNSSMISTKKELEELVSRAHHAGSIALDTEFVWERTYYPRLGLIQVALSDEDCHLIDPLAIEDLSSLGTLLSSKNVIKILHDAPQDLAILSRVTRSIPANIFDTRLAAGFSGLPSTISLANLTKVLLDIDLTKSQTRTNWLHRPLDHEQVSYALDDVRYLRALRVLLLTRIIVPEIKTWLQAELDILNDPQSYSGVTDYERYTKINGAGALKRKNLAVLQELAAWREQEARHLDRPRGHIVTDKALLQIAREAPADRATLEKTGIISNKKSATFGDAIIKTIIKGKDIAEADYPGFPGSIRLTAREKQVLERLNNFIQLKCEMQDIDPQLIGTTSEMKLLCRNLNNPGSPLPKRLTSGWRKSFLDEFFRQRF